MPRFLVVDDSPTVRLTIKAAIKKAAGEGAMVTIDEAEDAQAAYASFQKSDHDVVFLDMNLARQTKGLFALEAILNDHPGTRVVVVTGLPKEHEDVVEAISRGAFAYVPKPVRVDAIREVLDQIKVEDGTQDRIR